MRRRAFERMTQGRLELDICFDCHAIWFDQYESAQLAPGAVIELFGEIHASRDQPTRPLAVDCRCPRCRKRLEFTHDIQRTNRIAYYRCVEGHGRLTTFFQFLREKNFVRSLTRGEVERLRAHVAQVRCSSCGAPVDLAMDAHCAYCRAPIAILDADAVRGTLAQLEDAERKRHRVDPAAAIDALLAGQRVERRLAATEGAHRPETFGLDLVADAIGLLMRKI
jgi:hypothetical protein